jgi:hypothetical protein
MSWYRNVKALFTGPRAGGTPGGKVIVLVVAADVLGVVVALEVELAGFAVV